MAPPRIACPVFAVLAVCCAALLPAVGQGELGTPPRLSDAAWIWASGARLNDAGPAAYFRLKLELAAAPQECGIALTADNGFELWVNNRRVAAEVNYGNAWQSVERFRLESLLTRGANVIAIKGENLGGPGGLLAALYLRRADGTEQHFLSSRKWLSTADPQGNWTEEDHDDSLWKPATELARYGEGPWGKPTVPDRLTDPAKLVVDRRIPGGAARLIEDRFTEPPADFEWPAGIVYVAGRAPEHSTKAKTTKWPIRGSRAFFEFDVPAPAYAGHRLQVLSPARPDGRPRTLLDAGRGLVASPACSYDGNTLYFCLAPEGESFFHLYQIGRDGSNLRQLTSGPWHDYDPAPLPDGRLAFASTRIGCREEYHANTARSLFTLDLQSGRIESLTYHIVADCEPAVMADGRIVFVRQDNFMERAKVETHLHCVHPDGSNGEVLVGPERGALPYDAKLAAEDSASWLRNFGCGSPAPLPDGRLACLTERGPVLTGVSEGGRTVSRLPCDVNPFDLSPLPDGRLLVSTVRGALAVVDPATGQAVKLLEAAAHDLHSVAFLGPRPLPRPVRSALPGQHTDDVHSTGYLLCQSVFNSQQREALWQRARAVRVYTGNALTLRAAHHQYGHIGTEGVELGAVPLAPDGSFFARVPADRPLALQVIDGEGRALVNELSWIYVRPGETRTCVGCHAPRPAAPTTGTAQASLHAPADLLLQGNLPRFRANNAANGGVLNLQFDRFREPGSLNLHWQTALSAPDRALPPGRTAEVKALCQRLGSASPQDRRAAADRLAVLRERAATAALCERLTDSETSVRLSAALALSTCGTREAVEPLLRALSDPATAVARAAQLAAEHLLGCPLPAEVYGSVEQRREAARRCREWFAATRWSEIQRRLLDRLASDDFNEAHLALEALGHVGDSTAAAAVQRFYEQAQEAPLTTRLAALRTLGYLGGDAVLPLLSNVLTENTTPAPVKPAKSHEFGWSAAPDHLAGAAAEALGRIGTPAAERELLTAFGKLTDFWFYTFRTADHNWLMGCHSSIPHFRILEALDALGSSAAADLTPQILRSLPLDTDRGLFFENDAYETVAARVVHRSGRAPAVIETCLAVLGDRQAAADPALKEACTASPPAVSVGPLDAASRAAQVLSVVGLSPQWAPRVAAAFERFRGQPPSRQRCWTCFFLARALGKLGDPAVAPALRSALREEPAEAASGRPAPPNVFLHNAPTPLFRAAAARALGQLQDRTAAPLLFELVQDYDNAMEVRQAAAWALGEVVAPDDSQRLAALAAAYPEVTTRRTLLQALAQVESRPTARRDAAAEKGPQ